MNDSSMPLQPPVPSAAKKSLKWIWLAAGIIIIAAAIALFFLRGGSRPPLPYGASQGVQPVSASDEVGVLEQELNATAVGDLGQELDQIDLSF